MFHMNIIYLLNSTWLKMLAQEHELVNQEELIHLILIHKSILSRVLGAIKKFKSTAGSGDT